MNNEKKDGISLRTIHLWMVVGAVVISVLMFYSTFHLSRSFRNLTETSEQQIELRKAAREMMDASDYLTEKVQRFTIMGDSRFMDEYFLEAFEANHREEAIQTMGQVDTESAAFKDLKEAMNISLKLMEREYYAMRLVIEAQGIKEYSEILDSVQLNDEDQQRR